MASNPGQIVGDIIPLGIFVYLALVINRVITLRKPNKALENPATWLKILVYAGILIFSILIIAQLLGK